MKEYYFIAENKQMGPFTVEELTNQNLTLETLVWSSGMDNWVILKDIPELLEVVKPSSAPPPIPSSFININTLKNSEPINVLIQKEQKQTFQLFGGNKKSLNWFIGWCIFHSFAMLMSYSQIPIFNDYGKPKAKKFWPFVNYHEAPYQNFRFIENPKFLGILNDYDFTEFIFYVSAAFIILQIINKSKKIEGIN